MHYVCIGEDVHRNRHRGYKERCIAEASVTITPTVLYTCFTPPRSQHTAPLDIYNGAISVDAGFAED